MPKLLLADDSVTIQRVIELTFSGEDVQVVAVSDGEEAIARIPSERPDIVLADIGMPKRSGYEVAAFVKNTPALAHIPVLLLAGAFEPVDQARADQVRCDGVLVKPFEPQQVIARVRELVNGAAGRAPERGEPRAESAPRAGQTSGRPSDPGARPAEPAARVPPGRPEPRVIESRPVVEIPEPRAASNAPTPGGDTGDSLDDYFDRLDAAFASLGGGTTPSPAPVPVLDHLADHEEVPTIDDLLGGVTHAPVPGDLPAARRVATPPIEPPESPATMAASPAPPAPQPTPQAQPGTPGTTAGAEAGRSVIADVFSALLAAEQGNAEVARHLGAAPGPRRATDDLVEEVTRRVLERMAPAAVKGLVADVVSEIAERLVREEIARIRGRS